MILKFGIGNREEVEVKGEGVGFVEIIIRAPDGKATILLDSGEARVLANAIVEEAKRNK